MRILYAMGGAHKDAAASLIMNILRSNDHHQRALVVYAKVATDVGMVRDAVQVLIRVLIRAPEDQDIRYRRQWGTPTFCLYLEQYCTNQNLCRIESHVPGLSDPCLYAGSGYTVCLVMMHDDLAFLRTMMSADCASFIAYDCVPAPSCKDCFACCVLACVIVTCG